MLTIIGGGKSTGMGRFTRYLRSDRSCETRHSNSLVVNACRELPAGNPDKSSWDNWVTIIGRCVNAKDERVNYAQLL